MPRRLLCEGWNSAWKVEKKEQVSVALPAKILEREGQPATSQPVVRWRVTAQIQEADSQNQNGRRYPSRLWERVLSDGGEFMQRLANREVLAECEHPESGNTHLGRVSHLWERVWRDGSKIMGECLILKTPEGQKLEELLAVGHPLGFSSRGRGETGTDSDGIEEVKEDYFLDTFDAVAKPSVESARTQNVHTGTESFRPADHVTESIRGDQTMTAQAGIGAAAQYLGRCESTMAGVLESLGKAQDITRLVEAQANVSGLLAEMGATPVPDGLRESFAEARGKLQSTAMSIKARIEAVKTAPRRSVTEGAAGAGGGKKKPASAAVIETLMERNQKLQQKLRSQKRPVVDDQRFEVSVQLGEELLKASRALKKENEELKERYAAAVELLEQITTAQKGAKTKARIAQALTNSLISKNPAAKKLVEACRTVGEVDQAVSLITSLAGKSRPMRGEPLPRHGAGSGRNGALTEGGTGAPARTARPKYSNTVFGMLAEREQATNGLNG